MERIFLFSADKMQYVRKWLNSLDVTTSVVENERSIGEGELADDPSL